MLLPFVTSLIESNPRILLNSGADINWRDKMKSTALHVASLSGKLEMVDLLLEAGAEKELSTSPDPTLQPQYYSFLIIFKQICCS